METISLTTPKARKEHVCDWCDEKINVGEIYTRSFCKEDDVYVWKNHIRCEKIAQKLNMFNDGALSQDVFFENIRDEFVRIMELNPWTHKTIDFKEELDSVCSFHNL